MTNSGLRTGVRDEPHEEDLMNAALFELQLEIGIGKTAGTPMRERDHVAGLRFECAADLGSPVPYSKALDDHPPSGQP